MQEKAKKLIEMLCRDAQFPQAEVERAIYAGELEREGLLGHSNHQIGVYVLRDGVHGSPVLLLGGFEVSFRSLGFARVCRTAYVEFVDHTGAPSIWQFVE